MKRFSEKNEFFIFKSQKFRPVKFYFQKKLLSIVSVVRIT